MMTKRISPAAGISLLLCAILFAVFLSGSGLPPASTSLVVEAAGKASVVDSKAAVGRVLDDFHDAAARADEDRYFGHFAPEGVFFGTDPEERWTVEQFKTWAMPYFQRDVAWEFTPRDRHVFLAGDDRVAWFDEIAFSEKYGSCRGTGALRKIDGAWKITQYNLSIPVPNDLTTGLLRRMRGEAPDVTQVIVVRHAEKIVEPGNRDPKLTPEGTARALRLAEMTSRLGVDAAFASQFQRTQLTVAPTAKQAGVDVQVVDARDSAGLVKTIREKHAGETVVVSGHSNTVPGILSAFGIEPAIRIDESDYGNLYIVTLVGDEPPLLTALRF